MPNFGNALISEGVSDMIQGMMGMITGQFSLVDWATSKAISLVIALITSGIQSLKNPPGFSTLTKAQKFSKALVTTCVDVVIQVGAELISTYAIGELMTFINDSINQSLKPKIKEKLNFEKLKIKLKELRKQKGFIFNNKLINILVLIIFKGI